MIEFQNVSKSYGKTQILKDLSFTIPDGQIVGYIGPNGAGKSTTIKILSGILRPDSGECTVNGMVPWENRKEYVARLGVVFGQRTQLWWDVPVVDSFERGLATATGEQLEDPFVDGMNKVYKQLITSLEELGVKPIEAVGAEFNPDYHNAVMHVEDEEVGENIIVEEFQKGYTYKDFVVRHSMVKVAN